MSFLYSSKVTCEARLREIRSKFSHSTFVVSKTGDEIALVFYI